MTNTKIHSKVISLLASQEVDLLLLMEYYYHPLQDFYGDRVAVAVNYYMENNTNEL